MKTKPRYYLMGSSCDDYFTGYYLMRRSTDGCDARAYAAAKNAKEGKK